MFKPAWSPLRRHRSSKRARIFFGLRARARKYLEGDPKCLDWHTRLEYLQLIDELAPALTRNLLGGDIFTLEPDLSHLTFLSGREHQLELIATSAAHLHLLRYTIPPRGEGSLYGWDAPLPGHPLGLLRQTVGLFDQTEALVICQQGTQLTEVRLVRGVSDELAKFESYLGKAPSGLVLGRLASGAMQSAQVHATTHPSPGIRPLYVIRIRPHPGSRWRDLHTSSQPIQNLLLTENTLFFTVRSSLLMAIDSPLSKRSSTPRLVFRLETPSPIQALVAHSAAKKATLLAITADGTVFAILVQEGRLTWKFDSGHSVSSAAYFSSPTGAALALGTPDGQLEFLHPLNVEETRSLIFRLLKRAEFQLECLLNETDESGEPLTQGRPALRLLALNELLQNSSPSPIHGVQLQQGLEDAIDGISRGDHLTFSDFVRFLTHQCWQLCRILSEQMPGSRDAAEEIYLPPLLKVLASLGPQLYGDARRRLERLVRHLGDDWLRPEVYQRIRQKHAVDLSLSQLAKLSLRHTTQQRWEAARAATTPEKEADLLLLTLRAAWRRHQLPLTRTLSLQGFLQVLPIIPSTNNTLEAQLLVGLGRDALHLLEPSSDTILPRDGQTLTLDAPSIMTMGGFSSDDGGWLLVVTGNRLRLVSLGGANQQGPPRLAPTPSLSLDEPVTALEVFSIPGDQAPIQVIALGQADGRFRLLQVAEASGGTRHETWIPILDQHFSSAILQVSLVHWPQKSTLIIAADCLHMLESPHICDGILAADGWTIATDASVSAFGIAAKRPDEQASPPLLIGLSNGQVLCLDPPAPETHRPQLKWMFRAPQAITGFSTLEDRSSPWNVVAVDDGALYLLEADVPAFRVDVERYPFSMHPLRLPGRQAIYLLVSSPARATTLLETTWSDARGDVGLILDRLAMLDPALRRLTSLEETAHPTLAASSFFALRHSPLETLERQAERLWPIALAHVDSMGSLLETFLTHADPEARSRGLAKAKRALSDTNARIEVRVRVLLTLAARLPYLDGEGLELLLTPESFEEPTIVRALLAALRKLWQRFRQGPHDVRLWWRGLGILLREADPYTIGQLNPTLGAFARDLLDVRRDHVLGAIQFLQQFGSQGLLSTTQICRALATPHVLADPPVREVVQQYERLSAAEDLGEFEAEFQRWADLLTRLATTLPEAAAAQLLFQDLAESIRRRDYDEFARFLVDAPEFLTRAKTLSKGAEDLLDTLAEARERLLSATPAVAAEPGTPRHYQDRIHTLVAYSELMQELARQWFKRGTLEQQLVALALARWREHIVLPEIRHLQESVDLHIPNLTMAMVEEGGLVEVHAVIQNLGGRPLPTLCVGLVHSPSDPFIWEASPEWCRGPIHLANTIAYRTEILLEGVLERLELTFELKHLNDGKEIRHTIRVAGFIAREDNPETLSQEPPWRKSRPRTLEAIRHSVLKSDAGKLSLLLSDELAVRRQVIGALGEAVSPPNPLIPRTVVLDLRSLLEGPPRVAVEEIPRWWLPDRLARALLEANLITRLPERSDLRGDPSTALEALLTDALQGLPQLWLVMRRSTRSQLRHPRRTLELAFSWLHALVSHASGKIRVIMPGDFSLAARLTLPPSLLQGQVTIYDLDRPFPRNQPRALAEWRQQATLLFDTAGLGDAHGIQTRLIAHCGHHLALLRRVLGLLDTTSTGWLRGKGVRELSPAEPAELVALLKTAAAQLPKSFKDRLMALPFYHRLSLLSVAAGRKSVPKKDVRPGQILARSIRTAVRTRGNQPKLLYHGNTVLTDVDARYLRVNVGSIQGEIKAALFHQLNFQVSVSHLLARLDFEGVLAELAALGLIESSPGQSRRSWQIAVPLFRRWLYDTHPYEPEKEAGLKQLAEKETLIERLPLATLHVLNQRLRAHRLLADFLMFMGLHDGSAREGDAIRRWDQLVAISRRIYAWRDRPSPETFSMAIQAWSAPFSSAVENLESPLPGEATARMIDLSELRIPRLSCLIVYGLTRPLTPLRADRLREATRRIGTQPADDTLPAGALGLVLQQHPHSTTPLDSGGPSTFQRDLLGERLLPLSDVQIIRTSLGADGRRALLDFLAYSGFRFQHLSPYQPLGPLKGKARDVLFVGRESEIEDIVRHPDRQFAIVGSRRIGKTSLLLKVQEELRHQLEQRARFVYIDCATLSPDKVWHSINDRLRLDPPPAGSSPRLAVQRQLEDIRHPVVLLLDEIEGIFDAHGPRTEANAERFLWDLRSLANAGVIRLILAGYMRVYERRLDPKSAFHNFTTFRKLSALTKDAARALIQGPLSTLDITMATEGLVDLVVERTYRVPWIIQLFCNQLIEKLDARMDRQRHFIRRILREDVDGVSVQIEEELFTHFTSPRVMTAQEQLLLLTMVDSGTERFTEADVRATLETRFTQSIWRLIRYEEVTRMLDNLTLTLALSVDGGEYDFPLNMYPSVIRSRLGDVRPRVERLHMNLADELASRPPKSV